ncbi:MAG: hydrogenase 4 subunit B [Armatimonadetes bacterium]|nr:hydrogenase 4 subunit B [Armatimonadota bacterium]
MTFGLPALLVAGAVLAWGLLLSGGRAHRRSALLLLSGGCAALIGGVLLMAAAPSDVYLAAPFSLGGSPFAFRLDPLAGWFVAVIGLVAAGTAPYQPGYLRHLTRHAETRAYWPSLGLLLVSMVGVVLAANAPTFLVAWEVMSLSSFALVATDGRTPAVRSAALVYLGATRVGTAALMGGFLWAHAQSGSWTFSDWHLSGAAALGPGLLVLLGLGVKAGMWPFHLWLPIAHPAAPSPVSALMSGVMVKVAVYALVRLFVLPAAFSHPALGVTVLVLGAVSAFWGVLFALLQDDLKRLLAYCTVENVGLILVGVGLAMVASGLGLPVAARLALAAALFHVLSHAVVKALLFLAAGAMDVATGTRDLRLLSGLGRRLPTTFACFVAGSAAICALPPLSGFASEWLLYQSALGLAVGGSAPLPRFAAMLLVGWIALAGVLALACFVKATGIAFLGRPRSAEMAEAVEVGRGMRIAQIGLAAVCLLLGLGAPWVLAALEPVVAPLAPAAAALTTVWTLPMGSLAAVLALTVAAAWCLRRTADLAQPSRTYITWECGFGDLGPRMQATAGSFAQPLLRLFGNLMRYAVTRRVEGDRADLFPRRITVVPSTDPILGAHVYRPAVQFIDRCGRWIARCQAGSIHAYLTAMLVVLLLLLVVGRMVP